MSICIDEIFAGARPGTGDILEIRRYYDPGDPDADEYVISTYNDCIRLSPGAFKSLAMRVNDYLIKTTGAE